jgi:hypothetical protein
MTTTGGDKINLAPENDHDDIHDDGNVYLDGHNDNTSDNTARATGTGGTGGGNGPTNFNLQVEPNKIPEFFGAKSKDTISAADFI